MRNQGMAYINRSRSGVSVDDVTQLKYIAQLLYDHRDEMINAGLAQTISGGHIMFNTDTMFSHADAPSELQQPTLHQFINDRILKLMVKTATPAAASFLNINAEDIGESAVKHVLLSYAGCRKQRWHCDGQYAGIVVNLFVNTASDTVIPTQVVCNGSPPDGAVDLTDAKHDQHYRLWWGNHPRVSASSVANGDMCLLPVTVIHRGPEHPIDSGIRITVFVVVAHKNEPALQESKYATQLFQYEYVLWRHPSNRALIQNVLKRYDGIWQKALPDGTVDDEGKSVFTRSQMDEIVNSSALAMPDEFNTPLDDDVDPVAEATAAAAATTTTSSSSSSSSTTTTTTAAAATATTTSSSSSSSSSASSTLPPTEAAALKLARQTAADVYIHIGAEQGIWFHGQQFFANRNEVPRRLAGEQHMSDEINYFAILHALHTQVASTDRHRFYVCNPMVVEKVVSAVNNGCADRELVRISRRVDWSKCDFVLLPVHADLHFALLVLCYPRHIPLVANNQNVGVHKPCLLLFDSLHYKWPEHVSAIRRFLRVHLQLTRTAVNADALPLYDPRVATQREGWECGLHTVMNAEQVMLHPFTSTASFSDIHTHVRTQTDMVTRSVAEVAMLHKCIQISRAILTYPKFQKPIVVEA